MECYTNIKMLSSNSKEKLSETLEGNRLYISTSHEITDFGVILPGKVIETKFGEFYLCERILSEFYSDADRVTQEYIELFDKDLPANLHEDFHLLLSSEPEKVLFLDIETTGLSNCPLFLIGTMYLEGDNFKFNLPFARDYSEEASLLYYFNSVFAEFNVLATFNGKSFDIPFIKNRMTFHQVPQVKFDQFHFDVLIHSRRKWRGITPNCKLQTLEKQICGRRRVGDLPSAMIPRVYREFVRSGDTRLLRKVFHHNALDLITMTELIVALLDD